MRYSFVLLILIFVLAACSPTETPTETATASPTATIEITEATEIATEVTELATEAPVITSAPTSTAMNVEDLPAIELLSGNPDTCSIAESYSVLSGFMVHYYELTSVNRVHFRFEDADGAILQEADTSGENKNGEEAWGFYPLAYDVPANSLLSFTIEVYTSEDEDAIMTSTSTLVYNCTTGETSEQSFERFGQ